MMAVDLFCGLGGWTEGLIAEGWRCVGFDIERHRYPARDFEDSDRKMEYPGQLVIQDVLTLHGSQFRNADLIVASPPCQEYSYMAMPWTRAKQIAAALRGKGEFPEGYTGSRTVEELNALFNACFRIQREACAAAGRHIPLIVENVRGAQPWVGRARWSFGPFYLWGDVPALMPVTFRAKQDREVIQKDGHNVILPQVVYPEIKNNGGSWFNDAPRTPESMASMSSKTPARKAASALIAKIPLPLSTHIACTFKPHMEQAA